MAYYMSAEQKLRVEKADIQARLAFEAIDQAAIHACDTDYIGALDDADRLDDALSFVYRARGKLARVLREKM